MKIREPIGDGVNDQSEKRDCLFVHVSRCYHLLRGIPGNRSTNGIPFMLR